MIIRQRIISPYELTFKTGTEVIVSKKLFRNPPSTRLTRR